MKYYGLLGILFSCLSVLFYNSYLNKQVLFVGILSSRSNFDRRDSIRNSWFNSMSSEVVAKFFIGKWYCPYPMEDRTNSVSCEEWHINLNGSKTFSSSYINSQGSKLEKDLLYCGFSFTVHHPIVIYSLEIGVSLELSDILFINAMTNTLIVNITSSNLYSFKPILLEKYFEGILIANDCSYKSSSGFNMWDKSGLITFSKLYSTVHDIPSSFEDDALIPIRFNFYVKDADSLVEFMNFRPHRYKDHEAEEAIINNMLMNEAFKYNDIVLLDLVDVYKHLPLKLVEVHKWVMNNYDVKYVMKTDDDVFVDVKLIVQKLPELPSSNLWWGNIRKNWIVQFHGKWAEDSCTYTSYPAFACGAGNVVSADISKWLASNHEWLKMYQGEDVSMGIWMSAIKHIKVDDILWNCNDKCINGTYVQPQLSAHEINETWSLFSDNGFIACS